MAFSSLPLALLLVMTLALSQSIQAQNSAQDFLVPHNAARAQVGVGPMTWDTGVEAYAINYANQRKGDCALQDSGGIYGENLFWGSGTEVTAADAVKSWVDEKNDYNNVTNTCAAGKECRHYTQVVWANSGRLGCARVKCKNGGIFITCNYDPPGNYLGKWPYQNSAQDFLVPHNAARAQVGVGPMTWDTGVEAYAIDYANKRKEHCALQHSRGPYGENIFWGFGAEFTAADAVKLWVDEKNDYNYDSNTCAAGKVCGHYTQVVWRNSVSLGCAREKCNNGGIFITCNYDPPGNYVGKRPYQNSTSIRRPSQSSTAFVIMLLST